ATVHHGPPIRTTRSAAAVGRASTVVVIPRTAASAGDNFDAGTPRGFRPPSQARLSRESRSTATCGNLRIAGRSPTPLVDELGIAQLGLAAHLFDREMAP